MDPEINPLGAGASESRGSSPSAWGPAAGGQQGAASDMPLDAAAVHDTRADRIQRFASIDEVLAWTRQAGNENKDFTVFTDTKGQDFCLVVHPLLVAPDRYSLSPDINHLSRRFYKIESLRAEISVDLARNLLLYEANTSGALVDWIKGRDVLLIGTYGNLKELKFLRSALPGMRAVHIIEKDLPFVQDMLVEAKAEPSVWERPLLITRGDLFAGRHDPKYGLIFCNNVLVNEVVGQERLAEAFSMVHESLVPGGFFLGNSEIPGVQLGSLAAQFETQFRGLGPREGWGGLWNFSMLRKR
jgi:hypothetical protein